MIDSEPSSLPSACGGGGATHPVESQAIAPQRFILPLYRSRGRPRGARAKCPDDARNEPSLARRFRFDPTRELVFPEGTEVEKVRSDGYLWLTRIDEATDELTVLRWRESEEPQPLLTCTACELAVLDQDAEYVDVLIETEVAARYELWRLDDPEGSARLLATGIGEEYEVLDDGRLVGVPLLGHGQGPLELFESADEPGVELFHGVERSSPAFTRAYGGGDIHYGSGLGGRHGLFRVRLAP